MDWIKAIDPTSKINKHALNECYNLSSINMENTMTDDFRINGPISGVLWHNGPWPDIFKETAVDNGGGTLVLLPFFPVELNLL